MRHKSTKTLPKLEMQSANYQYVKQSQKLLNKHSNKATGTPPVYRVGKSYHFLICLARAIRQANTVRHILAFGSTRYRARHTHVHQSFVTLRWHTWHSEEVPIKRVVFIIINGTSMRNPATALWVTDNNSQSSDCPSFTSVLKQTLNNRHAATPYNGQFLLSQLYATNT